MVFPARTAATVLMVLLAAAVLRAHRALRDLEATRVCPALRDRTAAMVIVARKVPLDLRVRPARLAPRVSRVFLDRTASLAPLA